MATYTVDSITPLAFRLLNREGKRFLESSFGACPGHLQLNMAMLPREHAEDFKEFCRQNSAPCPLVYQSAVGEVGAGCFTEQSDIRTDLSGYKIYKNGAYTESVVDLLWHPWSNMVSFYLGCSFSFDDKLVQSGIKLKQLGLYTSNIKCNPVGVLAPHMVVSMRAVPKQLLTQAVRATVNVDYAHGSPIHIGRPKDIGIESVEVSDIGFPVTLEEGEVPVFWACGITSAHALQSAKLPLCFSHSPGCMFVADIESDDVPKHVTTATYPQPRVVCLDEPAMKYSIVSDNTWSTLMDIEQAVFKDPGNRGIKHLLVAEDFAKACLSLSKHAGRVGIALGFPCLEQFEPREENDGIAGAVYMARALMQLGCEVVFIIDSQSHALKSLLLECHTRGFLSKQPDVMSVERHLRVDDTHHIFNEVNNCAKFTHLIAIERPSPSAEGAYCTMSGRDISPHCDPIDVLFEQASRFDDVTTIGIGDGGNEVGMGKVRDAVVRNIANGETIAASTACDHLVTCGVSNWGGLALACGLYAVAKCRVHNRYRRNGLGFVDDTVSLDAFVLDAGADEDLHKFIRDSGFRDGISGEQVLTVDNLDYYTTHATMLQTCRGLVVE